MSGTRRQSVDGDGAAEWRFSRSLTAADPPLLRVLCVVICCYVRLAVIVCGFKSPSAVVFRRRRGAVKNDRNESEAERSLALISARPPVRPSVRLSSHLPIGDRPLLGFTRT